MPYYSPPGTDEERLMFLKRTAVAAPGDQSKGYNYISIQLLERVMDFIPVFEMEMKFETQKLGKYTIRVQECNKSLKELAICIQDFWEVLQKRVIRLRQPAEILLYYQFSLDALPPRLDSQEELLSVAAQIIQGDGMAVAEGYPPMSNPSAAEIARRLKKVSQKTVPLSPLDKEYQKLRKTLARLRQKADNLIEEVLRELRFNLWKYDPVSQREIMRAYGVCFHYFKGEKREATSPAEH